MRKHTVKCQFTVHCVTKPGDRVMIVGSHPALGSWDAEHGGALTLTWSKGHNWTGTISLEWQPGDYSPKMVSFKVRGLSCVWCGLLRAVASFTDRPLRMVRLHGFQHVRRI